MNIVITVAIIIYATMFITEFSYYWMLATDINGSNLTILNFYYLFMYLYN